MRDMTKDLVPTREKPYACAECGDENYSTSFSTRDEIGSLMAQHGICFNCGFWRVRLKKCDTIIGGVVYSVGNQPKGGHFNGMAGRRFDIEYFDGRRVTTYDLRTSGQMPDRYRDKFPDTAKFLGGAGMVRVGDGFAFNSSDAARAASYILVADGYIRCTAPACNCGSWHKRDTRPTEARDS